MEAADLNAQQLKGADPTVQFVSSRMTPSQAVLKPGTACYRCGRSSHHAAECKFKDVICHTCGKREHIAKVCRSKEKFRNTKQPVTGSHPKQANLVQLKQPDDSTDESDIDFPVLKVGSEARSAHPITVDMVVNGKTLSMELDTGAAVSIISEQTRRSTFPDTPLRKSTSVLRTYTGEPMTVVGEMEVQVNYGAQSHNLLLLVVAGKGPSLVGRDWLQHIQLNWKTIGLATSSSTVTTPTISRSVCRETGHHEGLQGHSSAQKGGPPNFLQTTIGAISSQRRY